MHDVVTLDELRLQSASALAEHNPAFSWRGSLSLPHSVVWFSDMSSSMIRESSKTSPLILLAAEVALRETFHSQDFPAHLPPEQLEWRRDALGKPFLDWKDDLAEWGHQQQIDIHHLHVSNTHDGGVHLLLSAYHPSLVGLGIDLVHLPRLRLPGKGIPYLHRFARQFMSEEEMIIFTSESAEESEEEIRIRVAAHFSLMEAASKALGTGLKIGAGMGNAHSLAKQSLGVRRLSPGTQLLLSPAAENRMVDLGSNRLEAFWAADCDHLVSAVLLWREGSEKGKGHVEQSGFRAAR